MRRLLPAIVASLILAGAYLVGTQMGRSQASMPPPAIAPLTFGAADHSIRTLDGQLRPLLYAQMTDLSAATSLSPPGGAVLVLIQAEDQNLRLRDDGTPPTGVVGFIISAGDVFKYNGRDLSAVQLIEEVASGRVNLLYYGY